MSRLHCLEHSILPLPPADASQKKAQGDKERMIFPDTYQIKPLAPNHVEAIDELLDQWNLINLPKCSSELLHT